MKTLTKDILWMIGCTAAVLLSVLLLPAEGATRVTLTTSRGSLTNMEPVSVIELIEMEDRMFYDTETTIAAEPIDLIALATEGVTNLPSFDCVTTGVPATLVAPDMAIGCAHLTYSAGQTITFGSESAIVIEVVRHPEWIATNMHHDVSYIRLDRELSVVPALVAPTNWRAWMGPVDIPGVTVIHGNVKTGLLQDASFYGAAYVIGDSGSPAGVVIDGRFVLVGVVTGSNLRNRGYFNAIEPVFDVERHFQAGIMVMPYTPPVVVVEPPVVETNRAGRQALFVNKVLFHPLDEAGRVIQ